MSDRIASNSLVRISSLDQSIWATGGRSAIEWHEYFPIIGGERTDVTVSDARIAQGAGKVTIEGDRLDWDPEGAFDGLAVGQTSRVVVAYTVDFGGGQTEARTLEIDVEGTSNGPKYTIEELGKVETGAFSFAAVSAADVLRDAHVFDTVRPVDIDIDLGAELEKLVAGLKADVAAAQAVLNAESRDLNQAATELGTATDKFGHSAEVFALDTWSDITGEISSIASAAGKEVDKIGDLLSGKFGILYAAHAFIAGNPLFSVFNPSAAAAVTDLINALDRAGRDKAATKADLAVIDVQIKALAKIQDVARDIYNTAVGDGIDVSKDLPAAFVRLLDDLKDRAGMGGTSPAKFSDVADLFYDAGDALSDLSKDRQNVQSAHDKASNFLTQVGNDVDKVIDSYGFVGDLVSEGTKAAGAALKGIASVMDSLAAETASAKTAADQNLAKAREDMRKAGYSDTDVSIGDALSDLGGVIKEGVEFAGASLEYGAAVTQLQLANTALSIVESARDNNDVDIEAEIAITVDAQAGLQVDMVLDAGSVDSHLDYKVDATGDYDAAADTYTINALATSATTGESVAFKTISPNLSFYAGIAYDVGATFELTVDALVKLLGAELLDYPEGNAPFKLVEEVRLDGWIDLLDFDSQDAALEFEIPGWVGDIIQIDPITFPTVKTEGRAAEVSADVYSDPTGANLDKLADLILDIANAKIDYSPEFKALLVQNGGSTGIDSDDFGTAFTAAIKTILASLDGSGDTDGDGLVPVFLMKTGESTGVDGLIHINSIEDVEVDLGKVGEFGFFTSEGKSDNFLGVTVDVDQLIATAVNVALGNAPDSTINPLDLSFGLDDIFENTSVDPATQAEIKELIEFDVGFEAADLDVSAGVNFSQKFALSVDDMEFKVEFEDGTIGKARASDGGEIVFRNVSSLRDTNKDGDIDYTLSLIPDATFFNDTQIGLNIGYTLDFIKAHAKLLANLPLDDIFPGISDTLGIPEQLGFDLQLGPVLRLEGDVDVLSADIFEDIFDFNAGFGTIAGSFSLDGSEPPVVDVVKGGKDGETLKAEDGGPARLLGHGGDDTLLGGTADDVLKGGIGHDVLRGKYGADVLKGEKGADVLFGNQGKDHLSGGRGRDDLYGGKGKDKLFGNGNDDRLFGDKHADKLFGGKGADILDGGLGNDRMTGGAGNDVFVFTGLRAGEVDHILDFEDGIDRIELSGPVGYSETQTGGDLVVEFDGGHKVVLHDMTAAEFDGADLSW